MNNQQNNNNNNATQDNNTPMDVQDNNNGLNDNGPHDNNAPQDVQDHDNAPMDIQAEDHQAPTSFELDIVIDKSGSMHGQRDKVVTGYNEFIQEQKKKLQAGTDCSVSLSFFSSDLETIYEDRVLGEVEEIKLEDYNPSGMTALNDAFADRLQKIKAKGVVLGKKRVLLVITDGEENSSSMSSGELGVLLGETKEMVEVVYMGSNQDAILNGQHYGARAEGSLLYADHSLRQAMRGTSGAVGRILSGETRTVEYTRAEREISTGTTLDMGSSRGFHRVGRAMQRGGGILRAMTRDYVGGIGGGGGGGSGGGGGGDNMEVDETELLLPGSSLPNF